MGLGNPGPEYEATRHNVGFRVIDRLSGEFGVRVLKRKAKSLIGEGLIKDREVVLAKPQTYMNNSGRAALALMEEYGAGAKDLIVVCDDFHLECGRIRVRRSGSSGGQKGLESIIAALGTQEFARVRIGIGPAPVDRVEFVLSTFRKSELPEIEKAIESAAKATAVWAAEGVEACMNAYNSTGARSTGEAESKPEDR